VYYYIKKSKGLPQQAEVVQGVPDRLRPRIFLMFQHYKGGRSSAKCTSHLYPRRNPWYSLSEAESTSGHMVLLGEPQKKSPVKPPGINTGTVRLVAQCLNHYATPGPIQLHYFSLSSFDDWLLMLILFLKFCQVAVCCVPDILGRNLLSPGSALHWVEKECFGY